MRTPRPSFRASALTVVVATLITAPLLTGDGSASLRATSPRPEPVGDLSGARYTQGSNPSRSKADERIARAVALADARVLRLTAGRRHAVVLIRRYEGDLAADDPCRARACYDVTLYRYADDRVFDVFVDVASERVVRVTRSRGQPPLSPAERRLAHQLAEHDPAVRDAVGLRRHVHPGLAKPMWPGTCTGRCATVVFYLGELATTGIGQELDVVVDLSRRRVVQRTRITCAPACRLGWDR